MMDMQVIALVFAATMAVVLLVAQFGSRGQAITVSASNASARAPQVFLVE